VECVAKCEICVVRGVEWVGKGVEWVVNVWDGW
jgi:hypothetical protein